MTQTFISKLILLLFLATGFFFSSCNKDEETQPFPATGDNDSKKAAEELISVNGYRLFVKTEGNKKPAVVFISGLGEPLQTWKEVQPNIAAFAQTFSYDRAGIGQSDAVSGSRTSLDIAKELHQLLMEAKIKGPYILVAHSIGGLHARMFAALYPGEVAGLVLADVLHEQQLLAIQNAVPEGLTLEQLLEMIADSEQLQGGGRAEFLASVTSAQQVLATRLPQIPLTVLTGMIPGPNDSPESIELKKLLHGQLAAQVSGGKQILAEQSGHHIQWDQPELIINAVKEMSAKVK